MVPQRGARRHRRGAGRALYDAAMLPPSPAPARPDFRAPAFLRAHLADIMAFYAGRCADASGGLYHFFKDDGTVYDARTRHLVSSTRYVVTHALYWRHFGHAPSRDLARHALAFVTDVHRQPRGGYAWLLDWHHGKATVTDATNHCYGLAFVLLAQAHALQAGLAEAAAGLEGTWQLMEARFWEPAHALYADEATVDWQVSGYRGQNANMHACEAMQAAFDATGERRYLERAIALADAVTRGLAARTAALPEVSPDCAHLIWEHYREGWHLDAEYNRGDRSNIFRPWGFQTGHQAEWAKLLLQLEARCAAAGQPPDPSRLARARALFDTAMRLGWDAAHGGLRYGFAPDGAPYDDDKYHWVQAESLAAAAWLATSLARAGAPAADTAPYWQWYERIWSYAWQHFVDHRHGAWFRILAPDNSKRTDDKSPAGKVDYHTMGACYDVLEALAR